MLRSLYTLILNYLNETRLWVEYGNPAIQILSEKDIQRAILILILGTSAGIGIVILFGGNIGDFMFNVIPTLFAAILGVYISYAILSKYIFDTAKERILPRHEVTESYSGTFQFPKFDDYGEVPIAIEYLSSSPQRLSDYKFEKVDKVYDFPDRIRAFLEPHFEELKIRFDNEGKFNWRKLRLHEIDTENNVFKVSETSYFRSYCTNFSPDYSLGASPEKKTLREAFKNDVISNGQVVPISESPFSNHLGLVSFVISKDGNYMLTVRSKFVSVATNELALPISGGFDAEFFEQNPEAPLIAQEAEESEEIDLSREQVLESESCFLGVIRRLDLLGKPDIMAALIVNELPATVPTKEHVFKKKVITDVGPIHSKDDLFQEETQKKLLDSIKSEFSKSEFEPTIAMLSWLICYQRINNSKSR